MQNHPQNTVSFGYPFGMLLPKRTWTSDSASYRYGFNGKETDNETGLQDYGFRIYNPALGKFLSVDPLAFSYPWNSPYAFAENRVIDGIDLEGLEWSCATVGNTTTFTVRIQVVNLSRLDNKYVINKYRHHIEKETRRLIESLNTESNSHHFKIVFEWNETILDEPGGLSSDGFYVLFEDGESYVTSDGESATEAGQATVGQTQRGSFRVDVTRDWYEIKPFEVATTFAHELFHTGGLRHVWSDEIEDTPMVNDNMTEEEKSIIRQNIMNSAENPIENLLPNNYRHRTITRGQLNFIRTTVESQQPNSGSGQQETRQVGPLREDGTF